MGEIETHQKQVEQSLEKERQAKDCISKLKAEIGDLTQQIDQGAGMSAEQELHLSQLSAQREQLEKDRDMLKQNTEMLQKICVARHEEVLKVEDSRVRSEEHIADIKAKVADKRKEVENEKLRKEQLEQQMKDLRLENENRQEELNTVQRNIHAEESDLKKIEGDIASAEREDEALEKRVLAKRNEMRKLQENQQRELQLRSKKDEIGRHATEKEKTQKLHEALTKKDRTLDEERKDLESKRNTMKEELKEQQQKTDTERHEGDADRKKIEDLLRERDILNKSVVKADDRTRKQIDFVKRQETQAMNLQKDIARWKADAQEMRKRIHDLERQREKYSAELQQAHTKYAAAKEDLKTRVGVLTDLKKKIASVQAKLKIQKTLYENA